MVPANPWSHASFRKDVPEAFQSCFDTAKRKIAKNAPDPAKEILVYKTKPWRRAIWFEQSRTKYKTYDGPKGTYGEHIQIMV